MKKESYPKALFSLHKPSIVWLEGDGNYSRIHLADGRYESLPYTLKILEEKLPAFVRIHKSSLVNPIYIQEIRNWGQKSYYLKLTSGQVLVVSSKRVSELEKNLNLKLVS
ncbi:LytTR family DNA-binding domain-containing protein [Spirosoma aerophilum]